jgi:hypothetical protein
MRKEHIVQTTNLVSKSTRFYNTSAKFNRIRYELKVTTNKNETNYVHSEFDAFSSDIRDYIIPKHKIINRKVDNLTVKSNIVSSFEKAQDGHIRFSPFNYVIDSDESANEGNYGRMQLLKGTDVVWTYNRHNEVVSDIGFGNNKGMNMDWTFTHNSEEFRTATLLIYAVQE